MNMNYTYDYTEGEDAIDLPRYIECGGHGSCNSINGQCTCQKGFHGVACDDMTDDSDIKKYEHDGPFFSGTYARTHCLFLHKQH